MEIDTRGPARREGGVHRLQQRRLEHRALRPGGQLRRPRGRHAARRTPTMPPWPAPSALHGERVEDPADLRRRAFERALANAPALVDVVTSQTVVSSDARKGLGFVPDYRSCWHPSAAPGLGESPGSGRPAFEPRTGCRPRHRGDRSRPAPARLCGPAAPYISRLAPSATSGNGAPPRANEGGAAGQLTHADRQRDPHDLPRVLPPARPRDRGLLAAGAAQRPDPAVHQCRHGAVQERVHRRRAAALQPGGHLAEMRARGRQAQRPGQCRLHRPAPHLLRDAGQFQLRRLLQAAGDRARLEPDHQGVRSAQGPAPGHGLRRGRRRVRAVAQDRRARRAADHPHRHVRQFLGHGRHRPVRPVLGDLLRPRGAHPGRPAGQPGRGRRPLGRDLEPRLHAVRAGRQGDPPRPAAALDRHRHGPRAHRRRAAGQDRQLRHRRVRGADRRLGGADRHPCRGRQPPLAQGDRRPSALQRLPDRRRRHAGQRGPRLRAAPDHAPRHAPRPAAGCARAAAVAHGAGAARPDGQGVPRAGPRRGADHRGPEARGDQLPPHAGARPAAARGGDRRSCRRARRWPARSRSSSTTPTASRST